MIYLTQLHEIRLLLHFLLHASLPAVKRKDNKDQQGNSCNYEGHDSSFILFNVGTISPEFGCFFWRIHHVRTGVLVLAFVVAVAPSAISTTEFVDIIKTVLGFVIEVVEFASVFHLFILFLHRVHHILKAMAV